jgi:hypothetical protein
MPTATLVSETLGAWREAERLYERTRPGTHDHETARLLVTELHALFVELTEQHEASSDRLVASRTTIHHARELLAGLGTGS